MEPSFASHETTVFIMKDTRVGRALLPSAGTTHAVTGTLGIRVHIHIHNCALGVRKNLRAGAWTKVTVHTPDRYDRTLLAVASNLARSEYPDFKVQCLLDAPDTTLGFFILEARKSRATPDPRIALGRFCSQCRVLRVCANQTSSVAPLLLKYCKPLHPCKVERMSE